MITTFKSFLFYKYFNYFFILFIPLLINCNNTKEIKNKGASKENSGIFIDSRDNQSYKWVRLKDGKKWMTENLNFEIADSWCFDNNSENCVKYGRLYTWKAAKKACPSGWYLPTIEEWGELGGYYGGAAPEMKAFQEQKNTGQAAYEALIDGGNSEFSALFGGYYTYSGRFNSLAGTGYYWTSSEKSSFRAWYYYFSSRDYFSKPIKRFSLSSNDKRWGFSCRCIQD